VLGVTRWRRFLAQIASLGNPSNRSLDHISARGTEDGLSPGNSARASVIARTVKIAAEHGCYRAKCLQQTLVIWCLLRRNQIEGEIRFGARKAGGELQAHAWVEVEGVALNEDSDVCLHFSPLERDSAAALTSEMPAVG